MGMDNLPAPGPKETAELTVEVEGKVYAYGHPTDQWQQRFNKFKTDLKALAAQLEQDGGPPVKVSWKTGKLKKK